MSIEIARQYLKQFHAEQRIMEFEVSSATVELDCDTLFQYSGAKEWVDVCKGWQEEAQVQP